MGVLETTVDPRSRSYLENRSMMLAALAALERALDSAREGGGERAVARHHARGKLLARERIELLVDRDSPVLELSPIAGWGTETPVGAAVVTAIGVVENIPCVLIANDPTVQGGAIHPYTLRKIGRATQIARQNRLPLVGLLETNGVAPSQSATLLRHAGEVMTGLAQLTAAGIPTIGVYFTTPSPDLGTGCFDHTIALRTHLPVGHTDHLAEEERDALRLARRCVRRLHRPTPTVATHHAAPPKHDPEDLLALSPTEPREILGRVLDASEFDEVQPEYATALCIGWGNLHGYEVGVIANAAGTAQADEARKAVRFARRAQATGTPLVLLQHGTATSTRVETAIARAVTGSPLATVRVGGWRGLPLASADARFRFTWPNADAAIAHPDPGRSALAVSGELDDDGVIDPRDTRVVLGFCLALTTGGAPT